MPPPGAIASSRRFGQDQHRNQPQKDGRKARPADAFAQHQVPDQNGLDHFGFLERDADCEIALLEQQDNTDGGKNLRRTANCGIGPERVAEGWQAVAGHQQIENQPGHNQRRGIDKSRKRGPRRRQLHRAQRLLQHEADGLKHRGGDGDGNPESHGPLMAGFHD